MQSLFRKVKGDKMSIGVRLIIIKKTNFKVPISHKFVRFLWSQMKILFDLFVKLINFFWHSSQNHYHRNSSLLCYFPLLSKEGLVFGIRYFKCHLYRKIGVASHILLGVTFSEPLVILLALGLQKFLFIGRRKNKQKSPPEKMICIC